MDWMRMRACIAGTIDQELLLRNEYLAAKNRILGVQQTGRLLLSDAERATLAEVGHRVRRNALKDVANTAKPDPATGWYRKQIARKFDGSKARRYPGRPRIDYEIEQLVVRMAKGNIGWGYDRIVKDAAAPSPHPDLNALAERWVKSVNDGCLSKLKKARFSCGHLNIPKSDYFDNFEY